jgi:hypothetical protein
VNGLATEDLMDGNVLMASLLFGVVGMGMFMYGKKAGRMIPLFSGVGLMVIPYVIPNLLILIIVCCGLTAMPWLLREA